VIYTSSPIALSEGKLESKSDKAVNIEEQFGSLGLGDLPTSQNMGSNTLNIKKNDVIKAQPIKSVGL
jgi:hypothetical protein